MSAYRCHCGRFLANVTATFLGDAFALDHGEAEIEKVEGDCKKHGSARCDTWDYEDFWPIEPKLARGAREDG